jgi:hypothetical protein
MARRTFIGNKYGKISDGVITSMTGHVSDSRSLACYYDVSDELKRIALGIKNVENQKDEREIKEEFPHKLDNTIADHIG